MHASGPVPARVRVRRRPAASGSVRREGGLWACSCTAPRRPRPTLFILSLAGRPTVVRVPRDETHARIRTRSDTAVHYNRTLKKKVIVIYLTFHFCYCKLLRAVRRVRGGKCISRVQGAGGRRGAGCNDDGHRIDFYLPAPPLLWCSHRSLHRPRLIA